MEGFQKPCWKINRDGNGHSMLERSPSVYYHCDETAALTLVIFDILKDKYAGLILDPINWQSLHFHLLATLDPIRHRKFLRLPMVFRHKSSPLASWSDVCACRIKTGHSNLVSCFGPRMRALAKVFYRGESRGKIPCQRPNPRAKTWHKIWMTGLNPNYDTTPISSLQNSQNKCQKSSFTYDHRRHLILPLPPVHALPTVNAPTCC